MFGFQRDQNSKGQTWAVWLVKQRISWLLSSALAHNEFIRLDKSLPANLPMLLQTSNRFGLGGAWQLIKQWNVVGKAMESVGVLTNICCSWKCMKDFLFLVPSWFMSEWCCARCLSPGKKGIILFLGSFCPPSIGNLSRIRICKRGKESKDMGCTEKNQKHAFTVAT